MLPSSLNITLYHFQRHNNTFDSLSFCWLFSLSTPGSMYRRKSTCFPIFFQCLASTLHACQIVFTSNAHPCHQTNSTMCLGFLKQQTISMQKSLMMHCYFQQMRSCCLLKTSLALLVFSKHCKAASQEMLSSKSCAWFLFFQLFSWEPMASLKRYQITIKKNFIRRSFIQLRASKLQSASQFLHWNPTNCNWWQNLERLYTVQIPTWWTLILQDTRPKSMTTLFLGWPLEYHHPAKSCHSNMQTMHSGQPPEAFCVANSMKKYA